MSDISEDGFWQMVEGEWAPTEKQLEAIRNGAIRHDGEMVQQEITESESPEVGELSPDGYYSWDGIKWVSVEFGTKSPDGFFIWNGIQWIPIVEKNNPTVVKKDDVSTDMIQQINQPVIGTQQQFFVESTVQHQSFSQQPLMIMQKQKTNRVSTLGLIIIFFVIGIAVTVFFSGLLYVWADSLADEQDQTELAGTWYNLGDTMTLYSNGTVIESSGLITEWSSEGHNITTTLLIDEEEIDLVWKYEIKIDSDDDRVLFMAYYDVDDGVQTNDVADNSCIVYIDSVRGAEEEYFENKLAIIPEWCEFAEE